MDQIKVLLELELELDTFKMGCVPNLTCTAFISHTSRMRSTCHTALHGGTGAGGAQVGTEIDWMALHGINLALMYE